MNVFLAHFRKIILLIGKRFQGLKLPDSLFPYKVPPTKPVYLRTTYRIFLLVAISIPFLYNCAGNKPDLGTNMPESMRFAYQTNFSEDPELVPEYQIGYNDVLEVKFFNNSEFNELVRVRPDGRVTLQRVGDIFVIGKTPSEIKSLVVEDYQRIIKNPEITVFVREFGGMNFYVIGAVNQAGSYKYEKNMTLIQAIAAAGGTASGAKMSSVYLLRKKNDGYVYVSKFDLKLDNLEYTFVNNIFIEPFDIIYVPKTTFGKMTDFMRRLFEGYLTPLDLYLRAVYFYKR